MSYVHGTRHATCKLHTGMQTPCHVQVTCHKQWLKMTQKTVKMTKSGHTTGGQNKTTNYIWFEMKLRMVLAAVHSQVYSHTKLRANARNKETK